MNGRRHALSARMMPKDAHRWLEQPHDKPEKIDKGEHTLKSLRLAHSEEFSA
jgi:hypothetical protein